MTHWSAAHNSYVDENGNPLEKPTSGRRVLVLRAGGLFTTFAALQLSWEALRGTLVERWVIHHGTVRPAAFVANQLTPGIQARAVDFSLRAPGGGLNILNGCEGLDALFLLLAAFFVAPMAWRTRCIGFLLGIVFVFAINQIRILGLFYAYREDPSLFYVLHATVAPIIVVLLVAAYFYAWLVHATPRLATTY